VDSYSYVLACIAAANQSIIQSEYFTAELSYKRRMEGDRGRLRGFVPLENVLRAPMDAHVVIYSSRLGCKIILQSNK